MTELNYTACRKLISAGLYRALEDAAHPVGLANYPKKLLTEAEGYEYAPLPGKKTLVNKINIRLEAQRWINGPYAKHLAEIVDLYHDWPPDMACYDRLKKEYLNRIAWMKV